jgi:pantoate--beta-alanine ligase
MSTKNASKMVVVESLADLRAALSAQGGDWGLVPTMGALHAGHASLVEQACSENPNVLASVFVNPTQFNDPRDLEKYPRTREADIALLRNHGVTVAWFPRYEELYADTFRYQVSENLLSHELCGRFRPGHFTGMLTVVLKLIQAARPTRVYFGEKDYQQLELVRGMLEAFFVPTELRACPIFRDEAGLALSSRNARLSQTGISTARAFARELAHPEHTLQSLRTSLETLDLSIEYLEDHDKRRYGAVNIEGIRLIDNRPLSTHHESQKESTL